MLMRIVLITLALAAAGFVAGGVVGMVMMVLWMAPAGIPGAFDGEMLLYGLVFGGTVGAVLGPASAWLLMRHVPLWLAMGGTAAGTILGALVGLVAGGPGGSFYGGLAGFGAAAVALRLRRPRGALAQPDIARVGRGV